MVFVKTHDISEIVRENIGKEVILGGWIEDLRKLGKMTFITLRDVSGISQVIVKGELNDRLGEINRQSVVSVKGIVQETKARDFDFEINAKDIEVLGKA
ncbi:MAG: aspartate--tRNA(Asn) ligase, partial [Nitrosarchaeum sp.]|nr:aspartate--tRNA(Asn) ligase [Nitrosarchaeum sp.]